MNMFKLSVIIPVYNVEHYIASTVESLFDQYNADVEYIFVNDCGTDNSWQVLQKVLEKYPECRSNVVLVCHEHNQGVESARITGLAKARGTYIWFVDSDDIIALGGIVAVLNALESQPDYLALNFCNLQPGDLMPEILSPAKTRKMDPDSLFAEIISHSGKRQGACVNIIKRSLTENKPMLKTGLKIAEDYVMHVRWTMNLSSAVELVPPVYGYIQRSQSATGAADFSFWCQCLEKAFALLEQEISLEENDERKSFLRDTLKNAKINARMTLFCRMMNDYPRENHAEMLKQYRFASEERNLFRMISSVKLPMIPVAICDKFHWYGLMMCYTRMARKLLRFLSRRFR